ncbi:hypothetical protein SLEP1_g30367 [Rubroshorea leprosula]|uniref:Uncharacterized protein n=1 Tax=Rubroshorea leprosula TaxID=152421 RepID=A0AAV5JZU2_9ROSI|nr:hypothetical protein SLEP1_g30367 [Rubroshorea leprosula]
MVSSTSTVIPGSSRDKLPATNLTPNRSAGHSSEAEFAQSFDDGTNLSSERVRVFHPILWKIKRLFRIGSERRLRIATSEVRDFAKNIVREKKTRTQTEILARISGSFIPILEFWQFQ